MQINEELLVKYTLPLEKRKQIHIAWLKALLSPMQRMNNFDNDYQNGSVYPTYSGTATYSIGDVVNGGVSNVFGIYESQTNNNSGNLPSDTTNWLLVNQYQIGVNERANFTANKILFEFGLNQYFGTTFRQPNGVTSSSVRSDIYLEDNNIIVNQFIVGGSNTNSSYVYTDHSTGFVVNSAVTVTTYQYNIYVPNALLTALPSGELNIRNIADKYNYYALTYQVIGY